MQFYDIAPGIKGRRRLAGTVWEMTMTWNLRLIVAALIAMLVVLQYRLWFGEGSFAEVRSLQQQITDQRGKLERLRQTDESLRAEVHSLKTDDAAIEARARSQLGMIREGETYFQLLLPGIKRDDE